MKRDEKRLANKEKGSGEVSASESQIVPQVIANLAHELKTPIHCILTLAKLLETEAEGPLNAEQKRQAGMIVSNGNKLLELVLDLLNYCTSAADSGPLVFGWYDVRAQFEEIGQTFEVLAGQSGIKFSFDLQNLEENICSNKTLVARIVNNLIGNAVKYSPEGSEVSLWAESTKDGNLRFEVVDSGSGIPIELQQKVFEDFFQIGKPEFRDFGGVGLGLALVRSALERLEGSIELKSEKGSGTLFVVSLPSRKENAEVFKVLILEKDSSVISSLTACLNAQHVLNQAVDNTDSLCLMISEEAPNLVIAALDALGEARFQEMEKIVENCKVESVPLIVLSPFNDPKERARCVEIGAIDFIDKPFSLTALKERLKIHLGVG